MTGKYANDTHILTAPERKSENNVNKTAKLLPKDTKDIQATNGPREQNLTTQQTQSMEGVQLLSTIQDTSTIVNNSSRDVHTDSIQITGSNNKDKEISKHRKTHPRKKNDNAT